jgi:hypothetical protein
MAATFSTGVMRRSSAASLRRNSAVMLSASAAKLTATPL